MFGKIMLYFCLFGLSILIPTCIVMWMHSLRIYPFRRALERFRKLPPVEQIIVAVFVLELWAYGGSKAPTNDPPRGAGGAATEDRRTSGSERRGGSGAGVEWFSDVEVGAGYALWRVETNRVPAFAPAPGSIAIDAWRKRGASDDWQVLDFAQATTNAAVAFGWPTNGVFAPRIPTPIADGLWAATPDGRLLRLGGGATNDAFSTIGLAASIVPEVNWDLLSGDGSASRFWYDMTPWRSIRATWQGVCIGRNADSPVSLQMEFMSDGKIAYRYEQSRLEEIGADATAMLRRNGSELAVDAQPETNATELVWYPLDRLTDEGDYDGDGLSDYEEIVQYGSDPSLPDSDGDGWSDYDEATGSATGGEPTDPMAQSVPNDEILARIAASPTNATYQSCATISDGELVSMKLWDGFAAEWASTNGDVVYERTVSLGSQTGWQHYFLSSRESSAGGWELHGMTLEWDDGAGSSGTATMSPYADSLYLPLTNESASVTIRLRAHGSRIRAARPMYLLGYAPAVTFGGGQSVVDDAGEEIAVVATNGVDAVLSVSVDRSGRPCGGALSAAETVMPGLTDIDELSGGTFAYSGDASGGTVTVARPGVCELPRMTVEAFPATLPQPMPRGSGSGGKTLVVLAPSIRYGGEHSWSLADVGYDWGIGEYQIEFRYPLNSECLWRAWHRDIGGKAVCNCVPEVRSGADDAVCVTTDFVVDESTGDAVGTVYAFGHPVWSGVAKHTWGDDLGHGEVSGCELLTELDTCVTCEDTCTGGKCDYGDGPSLNSVKFRISLGSPRKGQTSGFVYFESDVPVQITPSVFRTLFRSDANISVSTNGGTVTYGCADVNGRDVEMAPVDTGVRLTVRSHATGALEHVWDLFNEGGSTGNVRIRQTSRLGNVMSDETYTYTDGDWTATDNISGIREVLERANGLNGGNGLVTKTRSVYDAYSNRLDRVYTESSLVGSFDNAVLRETYWERNTGVNVRWRRADYWDDPAHWARHGQVRLIRGNDASWEYHDYDDNGFETIAVEQRNGSAVPQSFPSLAADGTLVGVSGLEDARVAVCDYTPLDGDDANVDDAGRVRTRTEYVVRNGTATCIGRTWYRYTRVSAGDCDAVREEVWRAASPSAGRDDAGNAHSCRTVFGDAEDGIPLVMRGMVDEELDENGKATSHEFWVTNGVVCEEERSRFGGAQFPTFVRTERDAVFGNVLSRTEYVTNGPAVVSRETSSYDEKNRLRSTVYSDGTSLTNSYSCCRLLWSRDREGRRRLRSAVTGRDALYWADEEVWLRDVCTNGRHRVTQHFCDGLGRETNSVLYAASVEGEATDWTASSGLELGRVRIDYPYGGDDWVEVEDGRGGLVRNTVAAYPDREVREELLFDSAGALERRVEIVRVRNGGRSVKTSWDGKWRRTSSTEDYGVDGCMVSYSTTESSDHGVVTNSVARYDMLGRVVSVETPLGITAYGYDGATDRRISETRIAGGATNVALVVYDSLGNEVGTVLDGVTSRIDEAYEEDVTGAVWKVTRDVEFGASGKTNRYVETRVRLSGLGGADGLRSEKHVATLCGGSVVRTVSRDAAAGVETEVVSNAVSGVETRIRMHGLETSRSCADGTRCFGYDELGRKVLETLRPSGSAETRPVAEYSYNAFGEVVHAVAYTNAQSGACESYVYDEFGRMVEATDALGSTVFTRYDGMGRPVDVSGATWPVRYGYDTEGRRTSLSTTRDGMIWDETTWTYDPATGKCLSKTYADGSVDAYSYTSDGLPLRTTKASGAWMECSYDGRRRLTARMSSDGTNDVVFAFDEFGRPTSVSADEYFAALEYGIAWGATNEVVGVCGTTQVFARVFDDCGRVVGRGFEGGAWQSVSYTDEGRVSVVSTPDATVSYMYGPDGRSEGYSVSVSGGVTVARNVVEDDYRSLTRSVSNFVGSTFACGCVCEYDALGRLSTRNGDTFSYDIRGELTGLVAASPSSPANASYVYDMIGNLESVVRNGTTTEYDANAINQYAALSYSADGELLSCGGMTFAYNSAGRLASVSMGGAPVAFYAYDQLGRRTMKTTQESTTRFFYDGWNLVREIVSGTNGTEDVFEYFWGRDATGGLDGSGGVGGLLYVKRGGDVYVPLYDQNHNVVAYVSGDGTTVAEFEYDGYGNIVAESGSLARIFRFRYSTKYTDPESGVVQYGLRGYVPGIGRWMTRDPLEEDGGENLYRFCENDPVSRYDILGLLTASEAFDHYKHGPDDPKDPKCRTPIRISFDDIDTSSVKASEFPRVADVLKECKKGRYRIKRIDKNDNLAFHVVGGLALVLGDVSLKLEGDLHVAQNGDWKFTGTLKCFDDIYDFDKSSHRGVFGEMLTFIGRSTNGKKYWIEIRGEKAMTESGNCCELKKNRNRKSWWRW